jgi:hypothetical protein
MFVSLRLLGGIAKTASLIGMAVLLDQTIDVRSCRAHGLPDGCELSFGRLVNVDDQRVAEYVAPGPAVIGSLDQGHAVGMASMAKPDLIRNVLAVHMLASGVIAFQRFCDAQNHANVRKRTNAIPDRSPAPIDARTASC